MFLAISILIFAGIFVTLIALSGSIKTHKLVPLYRGIYPTVTVVRPVKGLDVGAIENFRAALQTGYPNQVETIFVFDDQNDPAYPLTQKVVEEYHQSGGKNPVRILISGPPPTGRTGKLHAMIIGEAEATFELIAFADSDTRPDQSVLRILVETLLSTPKAGSSFVPVVVDQPLRRIGDVFYALLQNSLYAPWALLAAGRSRTLPFIMGQYMIFTRQCLQKIGGVSCAAGQLVDDMVIGKIVHANGFVNAIAPYSLSNISSGLSLTDFMPIYSKWLQFGKNGLPFSFLWRHWLFGSFFFIPLILLVPAILLGYWFAVALCVANFVFLCFVLMWIHEKFGGSRVPLRFWWAPFTMLIMVPAIIISNRISKEVTWRGRVYKVDHRAALS